MSAWRLAAALLAGVAGTARVSGHESTLPHFLLGQAAAPALAPVVGPVAPLTIELALAPANEPTAGLVRVTALATGRRVDLPAHLRRPMGWFSLGARTTIDVPVGEVLIEACRGLDTVLAREKITVAADGRTHMARLKLRRFHDPAARRLVGANTHLHLMLNNPRTMGGAWLRTRIEAEQYLAGIGRSDALDLVFVSFLVRAGESQNYISNEFSRDDLQRLSGAGPRFINGEEHRHEGGRSSRRGGPDELRYGHVLFLDLPRRVEPVSYGGIFTPGAPPSDAVPMQRAIRDARGQGATIVWCHGRQGTEDVPNWIAGLVHAQNIYDGGSEGTAETVFYPYLNAGLRVPFSTGTDWGCYDFSRVYVPVSGAATSEAFRENLAQGKSFITNGTFLELDVEGRSSGDTLDLAAPRSVKVRARGIGRDDFARIEVVFNGSVVARAGRRAADGCFEAELSAALEIREPGWLALRIPTERPYTDRAEYEGAGANLFGKALFAHTSPVYVTVGGRGVRQPAAVRQLVAELEAGIAMIEAKGAFASEAERNELLEIYRGAIARLGREP